MELWDLLGPQASNPKHLTAAEKVVKDALAREESAGRITADQSRRVGWKSLDRSVDSPRQGNGYDCGIFMLTSMRLICNGLRLSKEACTQGTLTLRRARNRLAERIWAMGVHSEATRWLPQGTITAIPDKASPTGQAPGLRGPSRKRKQRAEGRLTLGSPKLRQRWLADCW